MSQRATPTASPAATAEASASELADSPSSSVRIVAWSAFQPIVPPSTPASSSSAEDCWSSLSAAVASRPITEPLPHDDSKAVATESVASARPSRMSALISTIAEVAMARRGASLLMISWSSSAGSPPTRCSSDAVTDLRSGLVRLMKELLVVTHPDCQP